MIEYLEAYQAFAESHHRYALLMGGAGSGKSTAAAQKMVQRAFTEKNLRLLVVRKVGTTLRHSCFEQIKYLIEEDELIKKEVTLVEHRLTFKFSNGSQIFCLGLDDPDKIKSITNLTCVWVEEATDLEEDDFTQLELRLRGTQGGYKQFILTFNPITEEHWIRKRFCQNEPDPDVYIKKTTYVDNPKLDDDYIRHLKERIKGDENLYRVYTLGEWGRGLRGGEFYKHFSYAKHCQAYDLDFNLPLHLSFDFNLHPYITCTVWQVYKSRFDASESRFDARCSMIEKDQEEDFLIRYDALENNSLATLSNIEHRAWNNETTHARQVAEFCLATPLNYTTPLCQELLRVYQGYPSGMFIYGDPSGRQGSTAQAGETDFGIIMDSLAKLKPVLRHLKSPPRVVIRGQFINLILLQEYGGIRITIDPACRHTLADYQHLKEDADGTKYKKHVKHPATGISYEEYGHCSDANDYFLCTYFADAYKGFINPRSKLGPLPMPMWGA